MKKVALWILSVFSMLCIYVGINELFITTEKESILPTIILTVLFIIVFIASVFALKLKTKYPYLIYLILLILFLVIDLNQNKVIKIIFIIVAMLAVIWILLGKQILLLIDKINRKKSKRNITDNDNNLITQKPKTEQEQTDTHNSINEIVKPLSEELNNQEELSKQNNNYRSTYEKDYFQIYLSAEMKIMKSKEKGAATVKVIQKIIDDSLDYISLEQIKSIIADMNFIDSISFYSIYCFLREIKVIDINGKIIMKSEYMQKLSELSPIYIDSEIINSTINENIAFDAYISIPNPEIEEYLLKLGILRKNYSGKYNKFTITNEQWEAYGKDIRNIKPLIAELRKTEEWHQQELFDVDHMNGLEFEDYIVKLLIHSGYTNVSLTKRSNDFGVDVICEKDDIKYAIQCKKYSHKLNNSPVQEVASGKNYYNCQVGVVVTNSYFTDNAKELADKNGILLWDRDKLSLMIKNAQIQFE